MKKLMLSLCLLLGGAALVNAQDQEKDKQDKQTQPQTQQTDDQKLTAMPVGELPQPVKTSLTSADYSGWTINNAFRSTQTDKIDETKSMEVYVIELKNGPDLKTIRFDKDGNKLEDEQKKDDQK